VSQDDIKLVCRQLRHQVTQTALAADQANRPWQTKYRPSDLTSDYLEDNESQEFGDLNIYAGKRYSLPVEFLIA
jgi:hypothetical protein